MSKKIDLDQDHFKMDSRTVDGDTITIHRGKKLKFRSVDGQEYLIGCSDPDISNTTFPFTVPADNDYHAVEVKSKAHKGDYRLSLSLVSGRSSSPKDDNPTMIIKVE